MTIRISFAARALALCVLAALVLAGAAAGEVSREGLVAEWHFDGDAKDSSGNGNDGTIYGASFVDGKVGKALSFDGVDDYVYRADNDGLDITGDMSVIAWINHVATSSGDEGIISKEPPPFGQYAYSFVIRSTDKLHFFHRNSGSQSEGYDSKGTVSSGSWHQVVYTISGTRVTFYIDGSPSGSSTLSYSRSGTNGKLYIGVENPQPKNYFNGLIDEVRIYNRALSADEIKASYEDYITPPSPKPTLTKSSSSAPSLSNSGGGSWQSNKEITIRENSGSTLTDYQVLVPLSGSNFPTNARSDGADIRFTDASGKELSYWIESWDYSGRNAKMWVKVSNIPASAIGTIRMYYGNPSASSASSIRTTFIFGDDFEYDDAISNHGWTDTRTATTSTDYASTGTRSFKATDSWIRIQNYAFGNSIAEVMFRDITGQAGYEQPVFSFHDGVTAEIVGVGETTDATHYVYRHDMTFYGTSVPRTNDWHKFKIQYDGTVYKLYVDGTNVYTSPIGEGSPNELSVGNWWLLTTLFYWDDIRVRRYASSEPTIIFGAEQTSALGAPIETPIPTIAQQITGHKPTVTATPESSNFYVYAGIGGIVILLSAMIALRHNKKGRRDFYDNIDLIIQPEKNSYEVGDTVSFIITVSNAAGDISAGSIDSPLFKQIDVPKVKLGDKYREKVIVESKNVGMLIGTATAVITDEEGNDHTVKKSFEVEITPPRPKLKLEMANEKIVKPLERSYIVLSISNAGKARAEDVSLNVQADSGVDIGEYSKPGAIDSNSISKIRIPYVCISAGEFNINVAASYRNGKQYQENVSISIQTLSLKPEGRLALELPSSIKMGEEAYGHIIIGNAGEDAMLNVTTGIDGLSVTIPVFSRIEPKKEVKERFPVAFNSHGSKIIKVQIDYEDEIGKRYSVSEEKSIIVRGLQLKPAIVIEVPQALVQGETASGKINIRNDGEEIIKDASLTVLVNGTQVKAGTFGEIKPKKGTTIDIPIKIDSERADLVANLKYKDTLGNEYTYQERSSFSVRERSVFASSAVSYQGALILYKVKVENKLPKPISDVKIKAYVPDVFLIKENEKTIAMLEPNNARTVTFEIRPTGECGECNISGKINYYNNLNDKREDIDISVRAVSIICPLLKVREISEQEWRNLTGSLIKAEEKTNEIPISARSLFSMVSDIIKDMNLYMLNPNITDDNNFFRGVARFYGEGVKELKYAAQIEVIGGVKKSQLILKAFAEREDALTGFYYRVLDEIEKQCM